MLDSDAPADNVILRFSAATRAEIAGAVKDLPCVTLFFDERDGEELAVLAHSSGQNDVVARFFIAPESATAAKLWDADKLASGAPEVFATVALAMDEVRHRLAVGH